MHILVLLAIGCDGRAFEPPASPTDAGFACTTAFECNVDAIALRDGECTTTAGDRRGTCDSGEECFFGATLNACIVRTANPTCSDDTVIITGPEFRLCGDPEISCVDGQCSGPPFS